MLVRYARNEYRTWVMDSRRWQDYQPRGDDIVIATYPKCGTTWMQRIVSLLVFQSTAPRPLARISPWIERREAMQASEKLAALDPQHRRFMKSHVPFDGLPLHDEVRYIHVARDGRDACMSFHNHTSAYTQSMLEGLDRVGLTDEQIGRPFPRAPADPAEFFHRWLTESIVPGHDDGLTTASFFKLTKSYWDERHRPNLLLVHFNDLKSDLDGEMRRISKFLEIPICERIWPSLVRAASFEMMREDGGQLLPLAASTYEGGHERFFHKGENGRWRGIFRLEDLVLYESKLTNTLGTECADWVARGRIRC